MALFGEEIAKIPTDLTIYTPESVAALKQLKMRLIGSKPDEARRVDKLAAKLKVARENLKPITYNGSADEEEVRALGNINHILIFKQKRLPLRQKK